MLTRHRGQPAAAHLLAHCLQQNAPLSMSQRAGMALRRITSQPAVNAVIECWLEDKAGETVRQVIEEQGWRHSEEARWFLYLAATGRFDEYLAEDYDFQTLRPEFLAAPAALKARIREAVVKAGEVRMNGLFLAEKRAAELTVADAEALVRINIRNHNWQALVGNLWWLPARQTLDALQAITAAKWRPDDPDQAALLTRLEQLAPLLAEDAPEGLGTLPLNPVYQKWLASGETGPLAQKSPAELKAMLRDETDPPDQIAALGALRQQGQLDAATVAKAGLSEHWMVRWVAVHFGADLTQAMRVNDAGIEWFRRLSTLKDAEALWTAKPCEVTRDGLEALREHLARAGPTRRRRPAAGGGHLHPLHRPRLRGGRRSPRLGGGGLLRVGRLNLPTNMDGLTAKTPSSPRRLSSTDCKALRARRQNALHQCRHPRRFANLLPVVGLRIEAPRAAQRTPLHPHHTPPAGAIGPAAGKKSMHT